MDIEKNWQKALKNTEVVRMRIKYLETFTHTEIPYIFLAESAINQGDCVVRKGKILVEKPAIILPGNPPQFQGFEFEEDLETDSNKVADFFLIRGVRFPSLKYNNQVSTVDIYEDSLKNAVKHFKDTLERSEDIHTSLMTGLEDGWQFSVLILVGAMVSRSAEGDIRKLFDRHKYS